MSSSVSATFHQHSWPFESIGFGRYASLDASLRLNQIYSRWQSLLFEFGDTAGAHQTLSGSTYDAAKSPPIGHCLAVAYLNLFEEAYHYRNSRVLIFWHVLPKSFWASIKNSMCKQFSQYPYLRSLWEAECSSWS
ncbi:protein of unknown function [Methylocaldum szegediense]|uniref:Uncharacterized protein n=1 Tax=Methylocaldum szegediense TaxID=73780 RepID=A0ABN8X5A9_9GAMM|nr:protein of unknown function [Methylocaldum szegediense]